MSTAYSGRLDTSKTFLHSRRIGLSGVEALAVVVILILVASVALYAGMTMGQQNAPAPTIITVTATTTTTTTTTPAVPLQLSVSGKAGTTNIGTSIQSLQFVSQTTGISYPATISNGQYSIELPNQDTYIAKISWGSLGVLGGTCVAGTLPIYLQFTPQNPIAASWSC